MGIKDLLPSLQSFIVPRSIKEFRGMRVAIDASGWLHKALYTVVEDVVDSDFQDMQLYVDTIVMKLNELRSLGVEPVMVFDGKRSPLKAETNTKREEGRKLNMENGHRLLGSIRSTMDNACAMKLKQEAISCFQRGMAVTHEMEKNTIAAMHKLQIQVVVAPYEADCQLVQLCVMDVCQAIMTEDSDVLVYAAVCGKSFPILYKFDKNCQMVQCINMDKVLRFSEDLRDSQVLTQSSVVESITSGSDEQTGQESNFVKNLRHFSGTRGRRMFIQMCVLAGCDYSDSLHGVGLVTAQQAILKFKHVNNDERLERVCRHFKLSCNKNVPDTYIARIQRAEALFHYHVVYNTKSKKLVHLTPPNIVNQFAGNVQDQYWDDRNFYTSSQVSIGNEWKGPSISQKDLDYLGAGTLSDLLRDCQSSGPITAEKLCSGFVSIKDYTNIVPRFPWEVSGLSNPPNRKSPHKSRNISYLWSYRRSLALQYGNIKHGLGQQQKLEPNLSYQNKQTYPQPPHSSTHCQINREQPTSRPPVPELSSSANLSIDTKLSSANLTVEKFPGIMYYKNFESAPYKANTNLLPLSSLPLGKPPSKTSIAIENKQPILHQRKDSPYFAKADENPRCVVDNNLSIQGENDLIEKVSSRSIDIYSQAQSPTQTIKIPTNHSKFSPEVMSGVGITDNNFVKSCVRTHELPDKTPKNLPVTDSFSSQGLQSLSIPKPEECEVAPLRTPDTDDLANIIKNDRSLLEPNLSVLVSNNSNCVDIYPETIENKSPVIDLTESPVKSTSDDNLDERIIFQNRFDHLQPLNLSKRKFVEVSLPRSKIASGSNINKKLKAASFTKMKLPTIQSFFAPVNESKL